MKKKIYYKSSYEQQMWLRQISTSARICTILLDIFSTYFCTEVVVVKSRLEFAIATIYPSQLRNGNHL